MNGRLEGDLVRVGGDARQRYYDSRGYGRPLQGNEIELAPVEAAHLLFRDDLDAVDGMAFREFFAQATDAVDRFGVRFLVYAELRSRGFYISPARANWVPAPRRDDDFVVYERGQGPPDGDVAYRVRVVAERETIGASALAAARTDVGQAAIAVVDEESEITYLDLGRPDLDGRTTVDLPAGVPAAVLGDRVVCWDPPVSLYEQGFFGRPLSGREAGEGDPLQLSLVEAASLVEQGAIDVDGGPSTVVGRGRAVEGERFDRRLAAYSALRNRNVVPKTGFKFGADFRTYAEVKSVDSLGHSELLVRVLAADHTFAPRDLALDVRLANGVRKTMVFALVEGDGSADSDGIEWLSVTRLTP
ncbi:MAG: tRNA-intron endonuclease [Halobacteriales archaeon]|jgi:tRNA-intron endonuclease